jgi:CheY-like chemotaxis protein
MANTPAVPARRLRILYVEDDHGLRELIADLLKGEGHAIETAVDGQDGLNRLREPSASYDLILTDIRMPVMDGLEMLRHLAGSNFNTPVIVFSAYDHELYAEKMAGLKVAAHLAKSDLQRLLDTIAALGSTHKG